MTDTRELLRMLANRARTFPNYPLGYHIPEVFAALGEEPPKPDVQPKGTPSSQWAANGEPDPHGDRYACERAALTLGDLTDDELANGAFFNYNEPLNIKAVMENRPGYHPPIAWMTAVKDRIRWLSRALEKAKAAQSPAPAHADAWLEVEECMAAYWDSAYQEAKDGREHDDVDGTAQMALNALKAAIRAYASATQAPAVKAETAMGDEMDRQLEEAWSENEELRSQLEEARAQPWPEWTTEILKTVREFSGYDGFDDASEGVNLPEEVRECLEALAQEAKPMATIGPAAVRAGYRGDVSVADFVCARLAQPAPAAQVLVNVAAVATIKKRSYDEGPEIEWLLEGGPYELAHDEVLLVADRPVTDDDGHGEVFIAASRPPVQPMGGSDV